MGARWSEGSKFFEEEWSHWNFRWGATIQSWNGNEKQSLWHMIDLGRSIVYHLSIFDNSCSITYIRAYWWIHGIFGHIWEATIFYALKMYFKTLHHIMVYFLICLKCRDFQSKFILGEGAPKGRTVDSSLHDRIAVRKFLEKLRKFLRNGEKFPPRKCFLLQSKNASFFWFSPKIFPGGVPKSQGGAQ